MENKDSSNIPVKIEKSRQVTALAKKAISYQKTQTFTNICCISLCPLIMVSIAGGLGILINGLISRAQEVNEFLYCSNVPGMTPLNVPIWNAKDPLLSRSPGNLYPAATLESVINVNFARVLGQLGFSGPPGAAAASFLRPCVMWFGDDYPVSKLYERSPNVSTVAQPNALKDTTNMAQPLGGWFGALANPAADNLTLSQFQNLQRRHWAYIAYDPSVNPELIGSKPKLDGVSPAEFLNPKFSLNSSSTGLLGSIPYTYFLQTEGIGMDAFKTAKFQPVPWYNTTASNSGDELDDLIGKAIERALQLVAKLDKSDVSSRNTTLQTLNLIKTTEALNELPYGGLYFTKIDHKNRKYSWNYHFGYDKRFSSATNFAPAGGRMLFQQTKLDNSLLANSENPKLKNAKITQGLRILPQIASNKFELPFGSLIGAILYPFGVSFLLPIFAITLVQEKERRILVMMRMNGMKSWSYYLSHYVVMLILYCISALIFLLTGYFFKLTFFTITSPLVLAVIMFIWGNVQIALAFFFATLFNKSRTALVVVFMIVLCSVIISLVTQQLYEDRTAPFAYLLWPPFAFYRLLGLMNVASYDPFFFPFRLSDLFGTSEASVITYTLIAEVFVFFGLSFYLDAIFPSEFGVTKPWHFPITDLFKAKHKKLSQEEQVKQNASVALDIDSNEIKFEDDDVREERARVLSPDFKEDDHLLV
ncbi:hypothetical protein BC833DRAFT_634258, partial [Globomyces pollinis-pini]